MLCGMRDAERRAAQRSAAQHVQAAHARRTCTSCARHVTQCDSTALATRCTRTRRMAVLSLCCALGSVLLPAWVVLDGRRLHDAGPRLLSLLLSFFFYLSFYLFFFVSGYQFLRNCSQILVFILVLFPEPRTVPFAASTLQHLMSSQFHWLQQWTSNRIWESLLRFLWLTW